MPQNLESKTIQGNVVWQYSVIPEDIKGAYIYNFAANKGLLAVTDPLSHDSIHLLDTNTGYKMSQLNQFHNVTVAITDNGRLLVAEGVDRYTHNNEDLDPAIWSGLPGSPGSFKPFRWIDDPPEYHREILFGKILEISQQNQAVIAGETDSYKTKGFLLLADWSKSDPGELTKLYEGIENGPQDIAVKNSLVYVADKDTPSIKAISLTKDLPTKIDIPGTSFNPVRVAATEDFLVIISYGEMYFSDQNNRRGRQRFGSPQDIIQGLAALDHNRVIFSLFSSNKLMVKDLDQNTSLAVKLNKPVENPCWIIKDPQLTNRIYVSGYFNGTISAIDLDL